MAPILGAIADSGGYRKRFLFILAIVGAVTTASLSLVPEGGWPAALALYLLASVGYYIKIYGGQWGTVLQITFLFGALVVLFGDISQTEGAVLLHEVARAIAKLSNRETGEAIEGELKGKRLKPRVGIMSFRKAWQNFHPDSTEVDF